MLEVLITLIIILLGVLGMAGMQMLAINNTKVARTHSLAAILASSLTATMQANDPYWSVANISTSVNGTTLGNSGLNGAATNCAPTTASATTACVPADMAAYDLKTWGSNVAAVLPLGTGQVTCNGTTPNVCAISVTWSEKNVALHNQAAGATGDLATGTVVLQTYRTFVNILKAN
jgi:type IV pilus assembly protein PilV